LDVPEVTLKEFGKLRNRLTHPKKLGDLTVTDAELKTANTVHKWYFDELRRLMEAPKTTTVKAPLPVRIPPASPTSLLRSTKDYIVMQPDGNVYHFDTHAEAEEYCKIEKDPMAVSPLLCRRDDLIGSKGPHFN
jgi:hypothetical protein